MGVMLFVVVPLGRAPQPHFTPQSLLTMLSRTPCSWASP